MSKKKKNGNGNGNGNGNELENKKTYTKRIVSVTARSPNQKALLKSIKENLVTIVAGPPGSGKTMLSVVSGLREFIMGKYDKMIFTRPCIEAAGENLGFLPGDLHEKIHPYMYPIFDFLSDYLNPKQIESYLKSESIMTFPLAFMRGCTFRNAFVLLDECLAGETKITAIIDGKKYNRISFCNLVNRHKGKEVKVLSYNKDIGVHEFKKVLNFFDNQMKSLIKIHLNNKRKKPLKTTKNHPFAVFEKGCIIWKEARELEMGDFLVRSCEGKNNNSILFNFNNYDILLGFLLGDGSLSRNRSKQVSYRLYKTHGMSQFKYMYFCMDLLNGCERSGLKSGYTDKPLCGFSTKSLHIDENFICSLYNSGKKNINNNIERYFTDRSLALWYMDDGHIVTYKNYSCIKIHTEGFDFNENSILKKMLDKKYNIDVKIDRYVRGDKEYFYLRLKKEDSLKIFDRIKEYIVPSMYYKLPKDKRGYFKEDLYLLSHNFKGLSVSVIKKIENGIRENVYNMEVEENNNYFADNILVHNCQNTTPEQIRMFLTRIGENCKVVITGDPLQSDVRGENGLVDACKRLKGVKNLGIVKFVAEDILRDPIVVEIEERYTQK